MSKYISFTERSNPLWYHLIHAVLRIIDGLSTVVSFGVLRTEFSFKFSWWFTFKYEVKTNLLFTLENLNKRFVVASTLEEFSAHKETTPHFIKCVWINPNDNSCLKFIDGNKPFVVFVGDKNNMKYYKQLVDRTISLHGHYFTSKARIKVEV